MNRKEALAFLESKGCKNKFLAYEKYAKNDLSSKFNDEDKVDKHFIRKAFRWKRTLEGIEYWSNISLEFEDFYNNNNIKEGDIILAKTSSGNQKFIVIKDHREYPSLYYGVCGLLEWVFTESDIWDYSSERIATEEEKLMYIEFLNKNGYDYDENTKKVEKRQVVNKDILKPGMVVYLKNSKPECDCYVVFPMKDGKLAIISYSKNYVWRSITKSILNDIVKVLDLTEGTSLTNGKVIFDKNNGKQ